MLSNSYSRSRVLVSQRVGNSTLMQGKDTEYVDGIQTLNKKFIFKNGKVVEVNDLKSSQEKVLSLSDSGKRYKLTK